ncbi:hypothetical protein D3C77_740280 [compost metagenome]
MWPARRARASPETLSIAARSCSGRPSKRSLFITTKKLKLYRPPGTRVVWVAFLSMLKAGTDSSGNRVPSATPLEISS